MVAALHAFVEEAMLHSRCNGAAAQEAARAAVGCSGQPGHLRGAHAALAALHSRLGYLCEEFLRLRALQPVRQEQEQGAGAQTTRASVQMQHEQSAGGPQDGGKESWEDGR